MLGNAGTSGLLTDFGIFGIMESSVANGGVEQVQPNVCSGCKNRESAAVA